MASVFFFFFFFFFSESIIITEYLKKGKTINASESKQVKEAIKSKYRGELRAGILLPKDNAPVHIAHVAVAEAPNSGFKFLSHSPYSLYLAPSNFFLFPKLKSHRRGCHFENNVICAVKEFLEDQDATFFHDGIAML